MDIFSRHNPFHQQPPPNRRDSASERRKDELREQEEDGSHAPDLDNGDEMCGTSCFGRFGRRNARYQYQIDKLEALKKLHRREATANCVDKVWLHMKAGGDLCFVLCSEALTCTPLTGCLTHDSKKSTDDSDRDEKHPEHEHEHENEKRPGKGKRGVSFAADNGEGSSKKGKGSRKAYMEEESDYDDAKSTFGR